MQFLDPTTSQRWLDDRAGTAVRLERTPGPGRASAYVEHWPAHALRALARRAMGWLLEPGGSRGLILVRDFGVIPSREDAYLYSLLRRDSLNTQTVWESPGHLFESHERAAAESLLFLALCSSWGFAAAADGGARLVTADNDGHVHFLAESADQLAAAQSWFDEQRRALSSHWKTAPGKPAS